MLTPESLRLRGDGCGGGVVVMVAVVVVTMVIIGKTNMIVWLLLKPYNYCFSERSLPINETSLTIGHIPQL
jgi:hypothetical protein